jgi:hypothetical protein
MLNRKSSALQLGQFIALIASLLIAGQIGFILYQGDAFCLNDGCKVVEQLTRVSPLVFNVVGFFFFQCIFWGLRSSRSEPRRLPQFVKILLWAALAVEGVLISFQFQVAHAFCFYCLGILGAIVLLNLLLGWKQVIPGLIFFTGVSLVFASLELNQPLSSESAFSSGVFASRTGGKTRPEHFLFYSSTCPHCENVIASLKNNDRPTVFFNPIDQVSSLNLTPITLNADYSWAANKALLSALGIDEIPVLITRTTEGLSIVRGERAILAVLAFTPSPQTLHQPNSTPAPVSQATIPGLPPKDGCEVSADCTDGSSGTSGQSVP